MRKQKRGLSLMEILITMVLLTMVIMGMAGIYPAAFRATLSTSNQTKAISLAEAVISEINNLSFYGNPGIGIADLANWGKGVSWTPQVKTPYPFYLDPAAPNTAIKVTTLPAAAGISSLAVLIEVTVCWKETKAGKQFLRKVTLATLRSENYFR